MRIALVSEVFLPKIDGISNRLRYTLECLREAGHEALLFAPEPAVPEHAGARVVRVPSLPFWPYPGVRAALPDPRIALELARFRADVVHVVGPVCLGVYGLLAARALRLPVVASYHTDLPSYLPLYGLGFAARAAWPLLQRVHGRAHLNLCPSTATRAELRRHGIPHVALWRGGVDTDRFRPERRSRAMRLRLGGGRADGPLVLYVGRLAREKRIDTLRDALDAIPGARLALVGDGPDRHRLERWFAGRPVAFTGFLSGDELASAYASADVFALPSACETLGFVVLEAMSSGLPVVAAAAGGPVDLVRHRVSGLLYDPERPAELVAALREVLGDPDRRRALAQQARKSAEDATWREETRKLVDHYRVAIARAERAERGVSLRSVPAA
jgi:glycosyltransferase involved in cell wall biosynthesis